MKLSLRIAKQSNGWTIEYSLNNNSTLLSSRTLGRIGEVGRGFPLPPQAELVLWQKAGHENLQVSTLERLFENVLHTDPKANDIRAIGNYLTAVLFGHYWSQICNLTPANESIEIQLYFSPGDAELQRLPWEMMYDNQAPFAIGTGRDVAIARVVNRGQENQEQQTINLNMPLKVLFVIGSKLDNALRPGAEYLGLLRRIRIKLGQETRNRNLNIKILTETTLDELEDAVNEFEPTVVHFICHGDDEGHLLLTKRDAQNNKSTEADPCNAGRLLAVLHPGEPSPEVSSIIVLNACHSSDLRDGANGSEIDSSVKESYRSLAARLIEGGAAVAVGMTGEVADGACRLFTRHFYQALVTNNPINISLSTAKGRRAAMIHFKTHSGGNFYETNIEWARPTLFLAGDVMLSLNEDERSCQLAEAANQFNVEDSVLCDRVIYMKAYQEFRREIMSSGRGRMLGFSVEKQDPDQYGATRLLREIATQALLEGLIPCPLFNLRGSVIGKEIPRNPLDFALRVNDAMNETRKIFDLEKKLNSFTLELAANFFGEQLPPLEAIQQFKFAKNVLEKKVRQMGPPPDGPDFESIRDALVEDFRQLATALEQYGLQAPILVLIDDLHLYDGVTSTLLTEYFFTDYGLGETDIPVSFVITYSKKGLGDGALKDIEHFINNLTRRIYAVFPLMPIEDEHEKRLAYTQFLLLRRENPLAASTLSDKRSQVKAFFELMDEEVKGIPSRFRNPSGELQGIIKTFTYLKALIDANDEAIFANLPQGN